MAGMDDYLMKPLRSDGLHRMIARWLNANDARPAAIATPTVNCRTIITAKNDTAKPSPASPKANRQTGRPMLPQFGNINAGRKAALEKPAISSHNSPTTAKPTIATSDAPAISPKSAELIALADGRMRLGEMAKAKGLDWIAFAALWRPVHEALAGFNLMRYSDGMR